VGIGLFFLRVYINSLNCIKLGLFLLVAKKQINFALLVGLDVLFDQISQFDILVKKYM
jgi:hypothetical protein